MLAYIYTFFPPKFQIWIVYPLPPWPPEKEVIKNGPRAYVAKNGLLSKPQPNLNLTLTQRLGFT